MSDYYRRSDPQDYGHDYASGQGYSSAREYAAAEQGPARGRRLDRGGGWQGRDEDRGESGQGDRYDGGHTHDLTERGYGPTGRYQDEGRFGRRDDGRAQDRGFAARAGDEVRSRFGDDDARRDERGDYREPGRQGRDFGRDHDDYHRWRQSQVESFDRDYQEYRDENRSRFHQEFGAWRTERQGQRDSLGRVKEHMAVVGSDGAHVGTVDKVQGDRILLTKNDADAGGQHHSIPSRWITAVDDKVTLRHTAAEAKARWHAEQNTQAMFGDRPDGRGEHGRTDLNRSFSGTY